MDRGRTPEGPARSVLHGCQRRGLLHGLPLNLFGCILYDTVRHGNPIVGDIVILKEGFTTPGERDFIGLDEDDIKFLGAMAVSLSGGGIKWESEAR